MQRRGRPAARASERDRHSEERVRCFDRSPAITEYGSAEDAAQFQALHAYSPYHHVRNGVAYPAVLMLSSDHDDRVDPMHARKFTAALQAATAGPAPVWLRIEQNAGHGGADVVKQQVEQAADWLAFVMTELGMAGAR